MGEPPRLAPRERRHLIETGRPYHGADLALALAGVAEAGAKELAALDDAAFFTPQGTFWSPAEHVRHLRKSTAPVRMALGAPRPLLWFRFGRHRGSSRTFESLRETYLAALAAGGRAGRFTPTPESPPPDPDARRREIMAAWRDALAGTGRGVARWSEPALDRYQVPHPLLGRLTMREILMFTVYHTAHHVNRVLERAEAGE